MLLPRPDCGAVAVQAPGTGPGYWAGAPCAVAGDGEIFLAYRLRRPVGKGRGHAVAAVRPGTRAPTALPARCANDMARWPSVDSGWEVTFVPWHLRQQTRLDAEERADPVQGLRGLVDQPPVAQDQDLLAREEREQVLELLAVAPEPGVVPEAGPARRDPALLLFAGPDEVRDRLQTRRPQMGPVGVGKSALPSGGSGTQWPTGAVPGL
jgi:hypothetical protein